MIAKLSGRLDATGEDWAIVDVGGVGYLVHCSSRTLAALGEVGEGCTVHTQLQVSENDMRLLGFADGAERDWFRLLTGVQGVGSKVGLAILSALVDRRPARRLRRGRCGDGGPRAGRGAEAGGPDRQRAEGQGRRDAGRLGRLCGGARRRPLAARARTRRARWRTSASSLRWRRRPWRGRWRNWARARARAI